MKSLFARGERTVYRGADLEKIGMPIGGICAGQLYLGGDGKLWHWDIFNRRTGTGAEHYAKPMKPSSPLEQGFALRITRAGTSRECGAGPRPLARRVLYPANIRSATSSIATRTPRPAFASRPFRPSFRSTRTIRRCRRR